MRVTVARVAAGTAVMLASTGAPPSVAAQPQVVDPAGDALGRGDDPVPVGSQSYADVTSVWKTVKTTRKARGRNVTTVSGFTATLASPPVPPAGTAAVYRMIAMGPRCVVGVDYYTSAPAGGSAPRAGLLGWMCDGPQASRRTPLGLPRVSGNTITWRSRCQLSDGTSTSASARH